MAIKIGKWNIAPQSGGAGTIEVSHQMIEEYKGRLKYSKVVRAIISENQDSFIDETLEIEPYMRFMNYSGPLEFYPAYNDTFITIPITANIDEFRVVDIEGNAPTVTLVANDKYTISNNVGSFPPPLGYNSAYDSTIKITFPQNTEAGVITHIFKLQIRNQSFGWEDVETFYIHHSSSDVDAGFIIGPPVLNVFNPVAASPQSVDITSNVAYVVNIESLSDISWLTLSRTEGNGGGVTETLTISVSDQAVGASARTAQLRFKSKITGTTLGSLEVHQLEGEPYSIKWANETLTFRASDYNIIKKNTLTANAPWQIEEAQQ